MRKALFLGFSKSLSLSPSSHFLPLKRDFLASFEQRRKNNRAHTAFAERGANTHHRGRFRCVVISPSTRTAVVVEVFLCAGRGIFSEEEEEEEKRRRTKSFSSSFRLNARA